MHSLLSILNCPQHNFSIEIVSQFIDKLTFNGQLKEINHLIRWLNRTCISQTSCNDWKLYPEELNMNTTKKLHVTSPCYKNSVIIWRIINDGPCNLIGSNLCDLFPNCIIFCFKSHLFPSQWGGYTKNKTTNQTSRLV